MKLKLMLLMVCATIVYACSSKKVDVPAEGEQMPIDEVQLNDAQLKTLSLQLGSTSIEKMSSTIQLQGKIDLPPQNIVSVNFPLGGYLRNTKLIPGMQVRKGDIIALMEDQSIVQLQQDYLSAKAKQELVKQEFVRQQALINANAGTSKSYQLAETEMKMQSVLVKSLSEKLKLIGIDPLSLNETNISGQLAIRSTINGYVSKVHVNIGKFVQPTETMFELIDPDDIHAALTIFEKDLPYIKIGNTVKIHFMGETEKKYPAQVILVNKGIDDDRTATAHCHFSVHPTQLYPGMLIQAEVAVSNKEVAVLPDEAIVRSGNQQYVFYKKSDKLFAMIPVTTGLSSNGKTEIVSGLEKIPQNSIVLNNAYQLLGALKNTEEE
ncbi:MAG: efflux RND transporter periplasmic adaptor subunit [Chitinophagaceae bacterium]